MMRSGQGRQLSAAADHPLALQPVHKIRVGGLRHCRRLRDPIRREATGKLCPWAACGALLGHTVERLVEGGLEVVGLQVGSEII